LQNFINPSLHSKSDKKELVKRQDDFLQPHKQDRRIKFNMGFRDNNFGSSRPPRRFGGGGPRRSFGGPRRSFGPREMTKIKCAKCGKEDEVPFKPREGSAVLCKECYFKEKGIEPRSKPVSDSEASEAAPAKKPAVEGEEDVEFDESAEFDDDKAADEGSEEEKE
jgi:CxxC-x17-CxxC domain-containing protein